MSNKSADRRINIWINDKEVVNSFAGIQKALRQSNNELRNMTRGSKEYNEKVKEVKGLNKVLASHRDSISGVNKSWLNLKTVIVGVVSAQLIQGFMAKIADFIPNLIKRNAELSDSFADVRKTTGLTEVEIKQLNSQLKKIDTRTPRKDLLLLARDAGKLGVTGVKNIRDFVESANMINVALGEDLGEGAIKNIGKLNDVFGKTKLLGLSESMQATGSAINALGQSSTANEEYILGFSQRIAGMAAQAGISIENTLGLAAATDQLGLKAEMSTTAIGKTIVEMYKDTAGFAKIAGMETKNFAKLLNEDANEAFIKVLEGLKGNNEGLGVMAQKLEEVGVDGARGTQVLASLATRTDILRESQKLSNEEFAKATSLSEEYNVKNNNLAGTLEKLGKKFNALFANSALKEGLEGVFGAIQGYMDVPLSEKLAKEQGEMNMLALRTFSAAEGSKERIGYIKELQEGYPQFFANLDAEKVANEDIAAALKEANGQYLAKIGIQVENEKLAEIMKNVNDLKREAIDAETEFLEAVNNIADENNFDFTGGESAMVRYEQMLRAFRAEVKEDDANTDVAGSAQFLNRTTEQRDAIEDLTHALNNKNKSAAKATAAQKVLDDQLAVSTSIIEEYNAAIIPPEVADLVDPEDDKPPVIPGLPTAEEIEAALKLLQKAYDDKIAIEDAMYIATLDKDDQEIVREMQKWDALIGEAEKYGLDVTALEEARNKAIQEIEKAHQKKMEKIRTDAADKEKTDKDKADKDAQENRDKELKAEEDLFKAKLMMYQSFANFLGAMNNFIGKSGEEMTDFQKGVAVAQIAINTAVAIAENVKMAIAAAAATAPNPAAPFLVAGYVAMGLASIMTGMNAAKNALAPAESPDHEETKVPKYARGSMYTPGGMAWVGEEGPELVDLPRGSKVNTAIQSRSIAAQHINTEAAVSAVSGETTHNELDSEQTFSSDQGSLKEMINAINRVGEKLDNYEGRKQVILSNSKFEKDQARIKLVKNMRNIE